MSPPVDVWQIELSNDPKKCRLSGTPLSPGEHERALRFREAGDRSRFIQRRSWLRRILANITGMDAARLELGVNSYGKPALINGPTELHFNLTSSSNLALCAIRQGQPVGVDLERIDPTLEILPVATEHFPVGEYSAMQPTDRRLFYKLWTAREAYLKGTGLGLSIPLREVNVTWQGAMHDHCSIRCPNVNAGEVWLGKALTVAPQYVATVATPGAASFPSITFQR